MTLALSEVFTCCRCGRPLPGGFHIVCEVNYSPVVHPHQEVQSETENEVSGALREQPPLVASTYHGGTSVQDDTSAEHEAKLRLTALGVWAQQGVDGKVPIQLALTAIVALATAADRFLPKPEAA